MRMHSALPSTAGMVEGLLISASADVGEMRPGGGPPAPKNNHSCILVMCPGSRSVHALDFDRQATKQNVRTQPPDQLTLAACAGASLASEETVAG